MADYYQATLSVPAHLAEALRVTALLLGSDTRLVSEASNTRPAEFGGFTRQHNGIA